MQQALALEADERPVVETVAFVLDGQTLTSPSQNGIVRLLRVGR